MRAGVTAAAVLAVFAALVRDEGVAHAIVSGETASDPDWAPVVSLLYKPDANLAVGCTGVLVAPNLVLTARHCLADADAGLMVCDAAGEPIEDGSGQGYVKADHAPSAIGVYLGGNNPAPTAPAAAVGKAIVHDGAATVCSHDLAALVLDRDLVGAPIASLHITPLEVGEHVDVVGFGATEMLPRPPTRQVAGGIEVLIVASDQPGASGSVGPSPSTFSTGAALCNGDSGAGAFAFGGAASDKRGLVGIGSRTDNRNPNPAQSPCFGPQVRSTFMRLSSFSVLVEKAFAAAGKKPTFDAAPRASFGALCKAGIECSSDVCGPGARCTSTCKSDDACPTAHACSGGLCIASVAAAPTTPPPPPIPDEVERRPVPSACAASATSPFGGQSGQSGQNAGAFFSIIFVLVLTTAFGRKTGEKRP